jgi:hypothetical protein
MSEDLVLRAVDARLEPEAIVVTVELVNRSDRTVHAYRASRGLGYEPASGTLRIRLTDRGSQAAGNAGSFVLPQFTAVDPHGSTTIELRLPRTITRIGGVGARGAPLIERVPIHEAHEVLVDVGWSDTPFYPDPRPTKAHPAAQLQTWERGLASGRGSISRAANATDRRHTGGPST